jgi:hypothetical protein
MLPKYPTQHTPSRPAITVNPTNDYLIPRLRAFAQ